jgi:3-deoxy-D-manno-octulosonic-acid transferase
MSYVLNLAYLLTLGGFLLRSLLRFGRRSEFLTGFWPRFWGMVPKLPDTRPVVWLHAVSIGEALLCGPILERLTAERPDLQFVLSVSTPDGYDVATREFPDTIVFWAPWDFSWAVRRVLAGLQPCALVIAENDFWPNLLSEARRRGVPLAIFNTRMSGREQFEHRLDAWLLRRGLARADWWGAVANEDAIWIRRFFGPRIAPEVTGSLKFDGVVRDRHTEAAGRLRAVLGFSPSDRILVAGSTHAPEEEGLAAAVWPLAAEFPQLRLVIVPRHPSRRAQIARSLAAAGIPFVVRSDLRERATTEPATTSAVVSVIDAVGALRDLWGMADYAFVGGSLARHGGQNMAEPASFGLPVCFGPHVASFQAMAEEFLAANAAVMVDSPAELADCLRGWLIHPEEGDRLGASARQLIQSRTEPLERTVRGILSVLPTAEGTLEIARNRPRVCSVGSAP